MWVYYLILEVPDVVVELINSNTKLNSASELFQAVKLE